MYGEFVMRFPEYVAKQLFAQQGIPVPNGTFFAADDDPDALWEKITATSPGVVVKAQVLTGGRGKAGGVKVVRDKAKLAETVAAIMGMTIKKEIVAGLLFEEVLDIDREIYVSSAMDRKQRKPIVMLSCEGGMDIESVAANTPEKILRVSLSEGKTVRNWQLRELMDFAKIPTELKEDFFRLVRNLVQLFHEKNCSLVEINPLVITKQGRLIAADGKLVTDDNADSGAKIMEEFGYKPPQEDPMDAEAAKAKLNFVRLDGTIGCMVNGAGLAMATMDALLLSGAAPANFLDIGGGAKAEQVSSALDIISRTPGVKSVFINIFGGIVRCDMVAQGLLDALKMQPDWKLPIIVRLAGTNEKEAHALLAQNPLFKLAESMSKGAKLAVEAAKI